MPGSYKVKVWAIVARKRAKGTAYWVRWKVEEEIKWEGPFPRKALADSFRSDLLAALNRGELFDIDTGRPPSMARQELNLSWYEFACRFVDMQWPRVAATSRITHAEALTPVTVLMVSGERGRPDAQLLRKALTRWAFRTPAREGAPEEIRRVLEWVSRNTRPVADLAKPDVLRAVLDGLTISLSGKPYSSEVAGRRRRILNTALEYAVELKTLTDNPLPTLKWKPADKTRKDADVLDERVVANHAQVRHLLDVLHKRGRVGRRMVAYYACLYFGLMRPGEAAALRERNLRLPREGWGEFILDGSAPHAGREWTDSGEDRDEKELKQRAPGTGRRVKCPPELTRLIWAHVDEFGFGPDGRLFVGDRNKDHLPKGTVNRVWRETRKAAFSSEVYTSPLAGTPYDLRHGGISALLDAGESPTRIAAWAGNSVEMVMRVYAHHVDGDAAASQERMRTAFGQVKEREDVHTNGTQTTAATPSQPQLSRANVEGGSGVDPGQRGFRRWSEGVPPAGFEPAPPPPEGSAASRKPDRLTSTAAPEHPADAAPSHTDRTQAGGPR